MFNSDLSPVDRYLSDAQLRDLKKYGGFNVTTPAGNTWRVLWSAPGLVNLIDPRGQGRTAYTFELGMYLCTADNCLAMLLLLQSQATPSQIASGLGYRYRVCTGEEFLECTACASPPPLSYKGPKDRDVRALYA